MVGKARLSILLLLLGHGLFGQSQAETTEYILRELKACGSDQFEVKEARFTDGDSVLRVTTAVLGQGTDRSLEMTLAEVDIYTKQTLVKAGKDDYTYVYSLVATPRGRSGGLKRNMVRVAGSETILRNILNGKQVKGLELALARLTEIVAGRRALFTPAVDPP
jgi:hypothetical protein